MSLKLEEVLDNNECCTNSEDCSDGDESSTSFHSLTEEMEALNVEESDFAIPESMKSSNKDSEDNLSPSHSNSTTKNQTEKDHTWFDTSEDIDIDPDKKDEYFVDEDYLKDLELTISDEDKLTRHQTALEKKNEGNLKFKENLYEEAAAIYTEGLRSCPLSYEKDRAILYANRAAARSKIDDEQKKGSIKDCDKAIELDLCYLKAIQRRANLQWQLDHLDEALKDFQRVLELDPGNAEARSALMVLPPQIEEKNEKLKAEMMGKLKDLGNMILKPFGLSTNNFQLNQNSESGGYTVNFNQDKS